MTADAEKMNFPLLATSAELLVRSSRRLVPPPELLVPKAVPLIPPPERKPGRLMFLDGLRALAALAVIVCHLYEKETSPLYPILEGLPRFFHRLMMGGNEGVQIFFVLSGFVIARSVSRDWVNLRFLGRFGLRRSLRLDPPYWIVLTLVLLSKVAVVHHDSNVSWFRGRGFGTIDILTNYSYLQTLFQRKLILGVSWTLCLEMMFYLTYVLLQGVAQRGTMLLHRRKGAGGQADSIRPDMIVLTLVFGSTFVCSLYCWYILGIGLWGHSGFYMYVGRWHMFFTGALLQWVVSRWAPKPFLFVSLFTIVGLALWRGWARDGIELCGIAVAATAIIIFAANAYNRWDVWLSGPVIQQLGRISYSIYLVHLPVCTVVSATTVHFLGLRPLAAIVAIPLCFAMSIAVAQLCYFVLEKPSLMLSQKVKVHRLPHAGL